MNEAGYDREENRWDFVFEYLVSVIADDNTTTEDQMLGH